MRFDTPVDRWMPVVVLMIVAWSWCVKETRWWPAVQIAIPIVIATALLPLDERMRLAAMALATGAAFAIALLARPEIELRRALFFTASAIVLVRWIPWRDVRPTRELLVMIGALLIVYAFRRERVVTPIAIAVAIVSALVTPAIPLRTVALPYIVALIAAISRVERVRLDLAGAAICAAVLAVFPWSGIAARGLPYLFSRHVEDAPRHDIRTALAPGESINVWLPPYSESLIVSGANVARLQKGTTLGWIEPGHVAVRIGDAADWGYMRREHFFAARNHLPRDPAGKIRDYGYSAWVDGAARIALPRRRGTIRVTAEPRLPKDARMQVEAVEMTRQ